MDFKLYNSLTKKKEKFIPQNHNHVRMYVCGITPYDYSHLGHGRSSINFDVLYRFLMYQGNTVTYVRNFTDIDDKIIARAEKEGNPDNYQRIAQQFIDAYHNDMASLNCLLPSHEPRVTQYIKQIIEFIEALVDHKKAYVMDNDVYFDLSTFADYGKLSGRCSDDVLAGARIEVDIRKRNPGDFVLWKGNTDKKFWESPWGYGRPGWHIECSVMSKVLLGQTIDIHGGGMDLIFPHHENEITQSESLHNNPLAHYWLHNAFITINKEKMSKSLGNFVTLRQLFELYDPMVFRFFILQHHYRTPIDFSDNELQASQVAYKKLINAFSAISEQQPEKNDHPLINDLLSSLCDDLNTPKFLGLVFETVPEFKKENALAVCVKNILKKVLGLTLQPLQEKKCIITPEIQILIDQREQARKEKNWSFADHLRTRLLELGYAGQDEKAKK
jgi:cysteinyl-tRNA synthetase